MLYFEPQRWYNQKLTEHRELISFAGTLTEEIITDKAEEIEALLEKIEDRKKRKIIYFSTVELLQNLYHHAVPAKNIESSEETIIPHFFLWQKNKNGNYIITTGNYVSRAKSESIKIRIDQLNELSEKEIRSLSKRILNDGEFSEKGGAGLGMIELIRRTGNKLRYKFHHFNENFLFFELETVVLT